MYEHVRKVANKLSICIMLSITANIKLKPGQNFYTSLTLATMPGITCKFYTTQPRP